MIFCKFHKVVTTSFFRFGLMNLRPAIFIDTVLEVIQHKNISGPDGTTPSDTAIFFRPKFVTVGLTKSDPNIENTKE